MRQLEATPPQEPGPTPRAVHALSLCTFPPPPPPVAGEAPRPAKAAPRCPSPPRPPLLRDPTLAGRRSHLLPRSDTSQPRPATPRKPQRIRRTEARGRGRRTRAREPRPGSAAAGGATARSRDEWGGGGGGGPGLGCGPARPRGIPADNGQRGRCEATGQLWVLQSEPRKGQSRHVLRGPKLHRNRISGQQLQGGLFKGSVQRSLPSSNYLTV